MLKAQISPQVVLSERNVLATTSVNVADVFGKEHYNVLQSIELLQQDLPRDFRELNFEPSFYESETGNGTIRKYPMYLLTRDAFTLLVMGFTGKKALQFKLAYIAEFNRMEALLADEGPQKAANRKEPQFWVTEGKILASSLNVADCFSKTHRHVMRDIRLLGEKLNPDFFDGHFPKDSYRTANGLECPMYWLTRTGLTFLLMLYSSPKYFALKCRFLEKYLETERMLALEAKDKKQAVPEMRAVSEQTVKTRGRKRAESSAQPEKSAETRGRKTAASLPQSEKTVKKRGMKKAEHSAEPEKNVRRKRGT